MSKTKTHVLVAGGGTACGQVYCARNALCREGVTCQKCKKTPEYKAMLTGEQMRHKFNIRYQGGRRK